MRREGMSAHKHSTGKSQKEEGESQRVCLGVLGPP